MGFKTTLRDMALWGLMLAALGGLCGCTEHSEQPVSSRGLKQDSRVYHPTALFVAIDRSGSTNSFRAQQLHQLDLLSTYSMEHKIPLELWAYGRQSLCIYGPRIPESKEVFKNLKNRYFNPALTPKELGTCPTTLLKALAEDGEYHRTASPVIVLLTDGDDDEANGDSSFELVAKKLVKEHPNLQLYVVDIVPGNRPHWQKAFGPLLKERLQLAGVEESEDALKTLFNGSY